MFKKTALVLTATALVGSALAANSGAAEIRATGVQRAGATMTCSVPNNVVCTVSSAKGLKAVVVKANTGFGVVNIVDETYNACPKQVQIHWDSAYQMSGKQIVECGGLKLKSN